MTPAGNKLESLYKNESNSKIKERLLLVMKVDGDGMISAHVARDLHRSRTWACDWLARYHKEGIDGLDDRSKSGRPSKLQPQVIHRIRKMLKESKHGWTTKQVNDVIIREGSIRYHQHHIYRLLHKWGFKQKVPRKVHVNTASKEEKEEFKKERSRS